MRALNASYFAMTVQLAGFITGLARSAMLVEMPVRLDPAARAPQIAGASAMPRLMAYGVAVLGLLLNAIVFVFFKLRVFGLGYPNSWLGATGYSAMGFLPVVVVHSAVLSNLRSRCR